MSVTAAPTHSHIDRVAGDAIQRQNTTLSMMMLAEPAEAPAAVRAPGGVHPAKDPAKQKTSSVEAIDDRPKDSQGWATRPHPNYRLHWQRDRITQRHQDASAQIQLCTLAVIGRGIMPGQPLIPRVIKRAQVPNTQVQRGLVEPDPAR